jgi:hypothetical protein
MSQSPVQSDERFFHPPTVPAVDIGGGGGASFVYLGVFMLLLAFFILLNAISHFHDQKVGAVLRSVDKAFSMPHLLSGDQGEKAHDQAMGDALQAIASLGDQVRSEVSLAKVDTSADGLTLSVTMPADSLFGLNGAVRADRVALLDRITAALLPRRAGVQVSGDVLMGIKGQTDTAPFVTRAGAVARALVANGAPAAAFSIGLEPTDPAGQVRLVFSLGGSPSPVVGNKGGAP